MLPAFVDSRNTPAVLLFGQLNLWIRACLRLDVFESARGGGGGAEIIRQ